MNVEVDTRAHPIVGATVDVYEYGAVARQLLIVSVSRGGSRADGYRLGLHSGYKRAFFRVGVSNRFVENPGVGIAGGMLNPSFTA